MTTAEAGFEERKGGEFLFDFEDFERMDEAGVFRRVWGKVELIEGKIREMAPISADHAAISADVVLALGNALKAAGLGRDALRVVVHATLKIGQRNAPEPDILIARPTQGRKYFEDRDAVLVVEVSISTRDNDLKTKSRVYAKAGVPEFWMLEPEHGRLRVFRHPASDGTWGEVFTMENKEVTVSPLFAPQIHIPLSELF